MEEHPDPPPTTVHPKHAALLHRLSHRTSATPTTTTPTQSFLTQFTTHKNSIQSSLSTASTKSDTDSISTSIESLEKSIAESSYFLPPYELRTCLNACQTLRQNLETVSNRIAPKKRFSFKNKAKPTSISEPVSETHILDSSNSSVSVPESLGLRNLKNENNSKPTSNSKAVSETHVLELPGSGFLVPESAGLRNLKNEVLTKELSDGEFVLSELDSCEVRLKGRFRALFVHKLRNCKVYSGPVSGSVLIEEAEDCVFVLASHQIRIHNAKRCDFYLRVRSRPIIEDCEGVRFAPYCLGYEGIESDLGEVNLDEENENWGNVDDFKWLKGFQSPNWSVLPESERIGKVTIEY